MEKEIKSTTGRIKSGCKSDIAHYRGAPVPVSQNQSIRIDIKNDLYLEPLAVDFDKTSVVSDLYMFQRSINNIIKVLNKITKNL